MTTKIFLVCSSALKEIRTDLLRMGKPKLLFYMHSAYPLFARNNQLFGGAEVNLYYLSKEFVNRGYRVEFLVADHDQEDAIFDGVSLKKIRYFDVDKYTKLRHKILRRLNFIKLLLLSRSDIFIMSAANEMAGYAVLVAGARGKKTVFRVAHDQDVDKSFTGQKNLQGLMYRFALPRFDRIVAQTEIQKKMLLENEGLDSRVISNGIPLGNERNVSIKDQVLWVGRDDPVKRPLLFLDLVKRLPDIKFVMILQGGGELTAIIKDEMTSFSNLEFIEHVSFFEIQGYFDRSLCLVNTSEKEGFSNTFIQACMGSTPILSYKVDPDNVITGNKIGFLCNSSTDKAVEFIRSLDSQNVSEYGANAFDYVRKKHDIKKTSDMYEEMLDEIMSCVG